MVLEAQAVRHVPVKVPVLMSKDLKGVQVKGSLGAASLMLGALLLGGCTDNRTTCYGIEPDGEVEKLRPCPPGWKNGDTRIIREDEFKHLEVVNLKDVKGKSTKTSAVKIEPTKKG